MENSKSGDDTLRRKSEERLRFRMDLPDEISPEDANELIHELRVHQIELEMQNDELRRSQVQLDESRMRYADLYDFAPVGYLTFNREGLIVEANLTAAKQLGRERARILDAPFFLYVLDRDRDAFYLHLAKVFKTGEPQTCEVRLRAMGGEEFYARLESIPVETADGRCICRTSIIDISQAKLAEQELQRAHDELEKRVGDRTAELAGANELLKQEIAERKRAEENLKISMEKLEQSSRELQDFAAIASHDLQEPLRKVTAFGNMLKQKCGSSLGEQGNDYMQRILKANQRMQSLLTALLEYSRLSTKTNPFVEVNLSNLIGEVLSDLEIRIAKTGGQVHVGILPVISADPTQMRQLFQNLIGNALKFHKEGEKPLVKIQSPANKQMIRISVEDNGIGFDEKHIERIFAPFQRLHGRSEYEGTGMGLAICKKIVERHGGSITAKSTPGKGSLFVIDLPLRQAGS